MIENIKKIYNIKHIFLDVGDTLLFLNVPPGSIYLDVLKKYGYIQEGFHQDELKRAFSDAWKYMNSFVPKDFRDRYNVHIDGMSGWWKDLIQNFLFNLHQKKTIVDDDVFDEIFFKFDNPDNWLIESSFFEFSDYCKSKGISIGIISNWDFRLRKLLELKGLLTYFNPVLISAEFGYEKPSKKIFNKGLELLGYKPSELIYIGDKIELDYIPTLELGWNPFLIQKFQKAPKNIRSLNNLIEIKNYLE
jgi:2-haloacid dehalogenase